jgi:pimeloyl-ACP methyl ester carboxylesterase
VTVDLSYTDAGSGAAVVLLHAFPLSSRMWAPQLAAPPTGWRLIAPDLRGFGASPAGDAAPSLDAMADDVAALFDRLGLDTVVLGGLSMGGYVAMAFLRRHPGRVRALLLADTKAAADPEAAVARRLAMADALESDGTPQALLDNVLPTLLGDTTKATRPEVVGHVRELVSACPPATAAWAQRAMAARPDSFATLRAADVPALVIVGEEDALSPPADAEPMVEALPRAEKPVLLPAAGHLTAVESPAEFTAALTAFLASLT